jgi:tetratricopeptide (TPR) repeat protein
MTAPSAILVLAGVLLVPDGDRANNPHFTAAETAFREQRWIDAAEAFARAHELDPLPEYLYAQAQAERMGGRCEHAIVTYRRFLAEDPPAQAAADAEANLHKCEAQGSSPAPSDDAARRVALEPHPNEPTVGSPDQPAASPREHIPDGPPAWYRDPWGGVTTWTGLAAGVGGAVLLGESHRRRRRSQSADTEQSYRDALDGAPMMSRIGLGLLVAGGALLVTGIIRYATVGRPRKHTRTRTGLFDRGNSTARFAPSQRPGVTFVLRW